MNLTKSIFILVYLISPISYLIIYSIFTLIRKNDILISIYQILPMLAIYYLVASVIASIFFEKIIKRFKMSMKKSKSKLFLGLETKT